MVGMAVAGVSTGVIVRPASSGVGGMGVCGVVGMSVLFMSGGVGGIVGVGVTVDRKRVSVRAFSMVSIF